MSVYTPPIQAFYETPWRNESVLEELYSSHELSSTELAELFGCCPQTVIDWLHRFDIPVRKPGAGVYDGHEPVPEELKSPEILEDLYWDEGMTTRDLAEEYDVCPATACRALKSAGIERRPPIGASGPRHYRWNGHRGVYKAIRTALSAPSWSRQAEQVRERDGRECQMCGSESSGSRLDVHHIIPIMCGGTNDTELLMTLCRQCHRKAEEYTKSVSELEQVLAE